MVLYIIQYTLYVRQKIFIREKKNHKLSYFCIKEIFVPFTISQAQERLPMKACDKNEKKVLLDKILALHSGE